MLLPITFSWGKHIGTRILQHGNEVGVDDGLRKQVFARSEEGRTLPFPFVFRNIIIDPMTGPYREMPIVESVGNGIGS